MTAILVVVLGSLAVAQARTGSTPSEAFEVVSIRENLSGEPGGGGDVMQMRIDPGGRLTVRNATLQSLLLLAYRFDITRDQLGPFDGWMQKQRFDIDARAAEGLITGIDREAARLTSRMLQALLVDRFKLRVRRDVHAGDVYVLSLAPGGLQARASANAAACAGGADPAGAKPDAKGMLPCHLFTRAGRRGFEAVAIDTADLADLLRGVLNAPVEDRARVTTLFDAAVHWNSDPLRSASRDAAPSPEPQPTDDDPDPVTALREQLGLRLDRRRGEVPALIVEHAEPPTQN